MTLLPTLAKRREGAGLGPTRLTLTSWGQLNVAVDDIDGRCVPHVNAAGPVVARHSPRQRNLHVPRSVTSTARHELYWGNAGAPVGTGMGVTPSQWVKYIVSAFFPVPLRPA